MLNLYKIEQWNGKNKNHLIYWTIQNSTNLNMVQQMLSIYTLVFFIHYTKKKYKVLNVVHKCIYYPLIVCVLYLIYFSHPQNQQTKKNTLSLLTKDDQTHLLHLNIIMTLELKIALENRILLKVHVRHIIKYKIQYKILFPRFVVVVVVVFDYMKFELQKLSF